MEGESFALVMSGAPGTPPADALIEYLNDHGAASVTAVFHPLQVTDAPGHLVQRFDHGALVSERRYPIPAKPPYTFPLDLLVPLLPRKVDHWIAFNCLEYMRGAALRRLRRVGTVTYWVIDFVPDRFGVGTPATRAYDRLDRAACLGADLRVELSAKARDARTARHGLTPGQGAPTTLSPIGAWTSKVPTTSALPPAAPRLIYSGGLHERQGILILPEMLARVRAAGVDATLTITGRGPDDASLRAAVDRAGVTDAVEMRGFLAEYRDVEEALATSSIAIAPYVPDPTSFSNFSDLSKLKAYAAAGLPIFTTAVPHNADELVRDAGAEVLPCDAEAFADAVVRLARDPDEWMRRRSAALIYAQAFDWNTLFDDVIGRITAKNRR